MNFGEQKNLVAFWLDDLSFGYFTEAQIERWLNQAQREVQKMLLQAGENFYLKVAYTTLVANQGDYALPDDFLKVQRLELVNQGTFPNEDTTELDNITLSQKNIAGNNTGTPSFFYLTKNRLVILPTPDSAKRINLYYSQKVSDLTADGETMDIPEQYHEFPCV